MANTPRIPAAVANAMVDAGVGTQADSGKLRLYSGTQPANGGDAITTQTLLAEHTMPADAFPAATGGVLTANAIPDVTILASGTVTWFRLLKSDGATVLVDGSVGTVGCDLNLNATEYAAGATSKISSFTYREPLA